MSPLRENSSLAKDSPEGTGAVFSRWFVVLGEIIEHNAGSVALLRLQRVLRIAARNFVRFRLQSLLIIVATVSGTAGVMVSSGYAAAGRRKILDQFAQLGTNVIIVTPQQSRAVGGRARTGASVTTLVEPDYKEILQSVAGISSSSPTVSATLRVRAGDLTKNTVIVGCNADYFVVKHWAVALGSTFDRSGSRQQPRIALLGATAARDLFGDSDPTGSSITVNRLPFTVAGVLAERGQGLDSSNEDDQVYVPLDTAMHRLMHREHFDSMIFLVKDLPSMESTSAQIHEILSKRHRRVPSADEDFSVQNRKSLLDTQLSTFSRLTFFMRWIAVSALAVSSLGLFGVTWISIRNRTREVGTRRAIGATRQDILVQFFAEGLMGAMVGCSGGFVVAYAGLRVIDSRAAQPFLFSAAGAFLPVGLYSGFALLASVRAVSIQPLIALRAE